MSVETDVDYCKCCNFEISKPIENYFWAEEAQSELIRIEEILKK